MYSVWSGHETIATSLDHMHGLSMDRDLDHMHMHIILIGTHMHIILIGTHMHMHIILIGTCMS